MTTEPSESRNAVTLLKFYLTLSKMSINTKAFDFTNCSSSPATWLHELDELNFVLLVMLCLVGQQLNITFWKIDGGLRGLRFPCIITNSESSSKCLLHTAVYFDTFKFALGIAEIHFCLSSSLGSLYIGYWYINTSWGIICFAQRYTTFKNHVLFLWKSYLNSKLALQK